MKQLLILIPLLLFFSCKVKENTSEKIEKSKQEIIQTEKDFEKMLEEKGFAEAFMFYAAEDGVINRNETLISGKNDIFEHYKEIDNSKISLKWTVDFVDVSSSCDLGYTYGEYVYSVSDSTGNTTDYTGIFQSIWKKQENGEWRFVWD